jgi:hypothetical protein
MERVCFVCGVKSLLGVRAKGKLRIVGVCEQHLPMLKTLRPTNAPKVPDGLPIVFGAHGDVDLDKVGKRYKPTLGQAIAEAEAYFQEQDARKA